MKCTIKGCDEEQHDRAKKIGMCAKHWNELVVLNPIDKIPTPKPKKVNVDEQISSVI